MIICKYTKIETATFVPHLDILRGVGMAIRRRGLKINFSDGFNPHARLFFTQPLPLGVNSISEYFCADSDENAEKFMTELNTSLISGVKILKATNSALNPNPAGIMHSCDYRIAFDGTPFKGIDFSRELKDDKLCLILKSKDKEIEKDVKGMVFALKNTENEIICTLACGNTNLRADKFTQGLLQKNGLCGLKFSKITKTAVYDRESKNLDELFFS